MHRGESYPLQGGDVAGVTLVLNISKANKVLIFHDLPLLLGTVLGIIEVRSLGMPVSS